MIVLRVDAAGHSADVRWAGAEAVLGSGPSAGIQRDDAAWAPREAVLVHVGREVVVVRGDGRGETRLRVGESMRIGGALVTLTGLLDPVRDDEPVASAPAAVGWEPTVEGDPPPAAVLEAPRSPSPPAPHRSPTPAATASAGVAAQAGARWGRSPTFEDEIVGALKRSPWFALSAAIHAVIFALMVVFGPSEPKRPPPPLEGTYTVSALDAPDLGGPRDVVDPERAPEETAAPELADPEPPSTEEPVPPDERPTPALPAPERPPDPDAALLEVPRPLIGLTMDEMTGPTKRRLAAPRGVPPPSAEDGVNEDAERSLDVNRKAAARVRAAIVRGGGTVGQALKGVRREDVLVVKGTFDQMETTLEELQVPYTLLRPFDVIDGYDFSRHKVVFWNCSENVFPPRTRAPLAAAVREFVRGGGYLFTTDWGVANVIGPSFPGTLETSGAVRPLPEMILDVQPAKAVRDHALLDGVFPEGVHLKWWLESASQDVMVAHGADVEVLIEAARLAAPPLSRSPVIAATFVAGRGRVLHVMGHFYQQKGNLSGAMGAQRLALNFLRMRLERDGTPASR